MGSKIMKSIDSVKQIGVERERIEFASLTWALLHIKVGSKHMILCK